MNDRALAVRENGAAAEVSQQSHMANVESSRAAQEVQAAMMIAQRFPRDETVCYAKIMKSCQRLGLAESAIYSYPKGGTTVKGPSIHLAKAMARAWGNLDYGIRELENKNGESIVESYCWDMESNVRETKVFTVTHERHTRQGVKTLTDPRDIYETVANQGARRLRACILGIIPEDIKDEAVDKCYDTMKKGGGNKPLVDRVREMVSYFSGIGVDEKLLEKRLGHNLKSVDETELVDLRMIANSLKNGAAKREDYFELQGSEGGHASDLNKQFANPTKEKETTDKTKTETKAAKADTKTNKTEK